MSYLHVPDSPDVEGGDSASLLSRMFRRKGSQSGRQEDAHAAAQLDSGELDRRRDHMCASSVPLLAAASGVMLLLSIYLLPQSPDSAPTVISAVISGIIGIGLLVASWNLSRQEPQERNGHPTAAAVLIVTALSLSIGMIVSEDLAQTAYLELLVVVAGAVMLRSMWLAVSLVGLWSLWLGVSALLSGTLSSAGWLLALVGATVISVVIHLMRVQALRAISAAASSADAEAVEDVLTGVLNRRGLAVVGSGMMAIAARTREAIACTFIDVDGLGAVNSRDGHDAGDEVLVAIAAALGSVFRQSDVLARWGGDEFVVLSLGPGPDSEDVERRMIQRLGTSGQDHPSERVAEISAGRVIHMPWQEEDLDQIVERADQEMIRRRRLRQARGHDFEE